MQLTGFLFFIFSTFCFSEGNAPVKPKTLTFQKVEQYVQKIDLLKSKRQLTRYAHPEMTAWGSLTGYWDKEGLVMLHSLYNAEKGFREITVYYYKEEICRIVCNDHVANWEQYEREHGNEEFDLSKLTYTDKLYDYTAATELVYRISDGKTFVHSKLDPDAYAKLVASAGEMKQFIEEEASK